MMKFFPIFARFALPGTGLVLMVLAAGPLQAQEAAGQLGILDLTANDGLNPATGNPWEIGDTDHLIFVMDAPTEAIETDIAFSTDTVRIGL